MQASCYTANCRTGHNGKRGRHNSEERVLAGPRKMPLPILACVDVVGRGWLQGLDIPHVLEHVSELMDTSCLWSIPDAAGQSFVHLLDRLVLRADA